MGRDFLVVQWIRIHLPRRGHGSDPWSGKIPRAPEPLSPCATTTEPVLWSPWATITEARLPQSLCPVPPCATREAIAMRSLCTATREMPEQQRRPSTMNEWMNEGHKGIYENSPLCPILTRACVNQVMHSSSVDLFALALILLVYPWKKEITKSSEEPV